MTEARASKLLLENLNAVYGYAFARLYSKDRAEDLTNEIVCEILRSVGNLKEEHKFWGFAWKVAENTFRKFIRREALRQNVAECDAGDFGVYEFSPEQAYIEREEKSEQIYLLRRELALLSGLHREICVAYYIQNKGCSEIAKEQGISVEMVKYHLFKTRKLLKEGIGMTRTLGEKSYNPGTFRLDFWGDRNRYGEICKRRLPGAIVLAASHAPLSLQELSVELGVAMPYLEEEVEILESAGLLTKKGTKYQTGIVILTDEYETALEKKTAAGFEGMAESVWTKMKALLPQVRAEGFSGSEYDDNRLMFALLNIAMVTAYRRSNQKDPLGNPKALPLGGHGWMFGHDHEQGRSGHFCGVTMETWNQEGSAWFSAENYKVIARAQLYDHYQFRDKAEAMCDAVLEKEADNHNDTLPWLIENKFIICREGRLSANFPVFEEKQFACLREMISEVSEEIADSMVKFSEMGARLLEEYVPADVRDQCGDIAKIHHRLDVAAILLEEMVAKGRLTVPEERVPLCVWGVKREV